mmetsp:Transcript_62027/g.164801  ORF Transcript_62027/g.164801 Transcript_62027/m.164801 type:complete len:293 (-) Transcript_62027:530-1408(-)
MPQYTSKISEPSATKHGSQFASRFLSQRHAHPLKEVLHATAWGRENLCLTDCGKGPHIDDLREQLHLCLICAAACGGCVKEQQLRMTTELEIPHIADLDQRSQAVFTWCASVAFRELTAAAVALGRNGPARMTCEGQTCSSTEEPEAPPRSTAVLGKELQPCFIVVLRPLRQAEAFVAHGDAQQEAQLYEDTLLRRPRLRKVLQTLVDDLTHGSVRLGIQHGKGLQRCALRDHRAACGDRASGGIQVVRVGRPLSTHAQGLNDGWEQSSRRKAQTATHSRSHTIPCTVQTTG